jgi:thiopurine S-methyltransferase
LIWQDIHLGQCTTGNDREWRLQNLLGVSFDFGMDVVENRHMKKEFWLERWEKKEIGFHQEDINPYLFQHWKDLHADKSNEVFVPLCGKSKDMLWLREQGYSVHGVELSSLAVQAFFHENGLIPVRKSNNLFECYDADGISIMCGDFFNLTKADLANVRLVYDRASLVALPPDLRERYVSHLIGILHPGTQILLLTFDYAQIEMSGPPFAVSLDEVKSLYNKKAEVRQLAHHDILAKMPRFQERGLSRLHENVILLTLI